MSIVDDLPRPRPAKVPARVLGPREARKRPQCPRGRLTRQVIEDVEVLVKVGTPLGIVADAVGVSGSTLRAWRTRADDALKRKVADRNQLDRLCIELQETIRRAVGESGVRVHSTIATAAGVTGEARTRKVRTTRTVTSGESVVTEEVERVEDVLPDWRAAAHLGKYRFREEMGTDPPTDPDEAPAGPLVSAEMLLARLVQIRAGRALAGTQEAITVGGDE